MFDNDETAGRRPLEGVRVLDFSRVLAGPYCTGLMADLGAEVIKVEPPRGDTGRMLGSLFDIVNAGKKSIVLDLKAPADRERLQRLLPEVDVLLEGFRPGVMDSLGAGPATAMELNPRLIYCSMSGFGQGGPYREYPGHDLNFQALTGVCHMMRSGAGTPYGCALPIADLSSGLSAVASITAALYGRERDGQGRQIDLALTDTVLSWAYVWAEGLTPSEVRFSGALRPMRRWLDRRATDHPEVGAWLSKASQWLGSSLATEGLDRAGDRVQKTAAWQRLVRLRLHALPHYALYQTLDDRWISVGIVDERKFWIALCRGLDLPNPVALSLGAVPLGARALTEGPIRRVIARAFRRRTLDQWLHHFDRTRVPVTPVLPLEEALADAQLAGRIADAHGLPALPLPFAAQPLHAAPKLGADNATVLGGA